MIMGKVNPARFNFHNTEVKINQQKECGRVKTKKHIFLEVGENWKQYLFSSNGMPKLLFNKIAINA